eukprot:3468546-Pleurochrysis_carterae.AAC.1
MSDGFQTRWTERRSTEARVPQGATQSGERGRARTGGGCKKLRPRKMNSDLRLHSAWKRRAQAMKELKEDVCFRSHLQIGWEARQLLRNRAADGVEPEIPAMGGGRSHASNICRWGCPYACALAPASLAYFGQASAC